MVRFLIFLSFSFLVGMGTAGEGALKSTSSSGSDASSSVATASPVTALAPIENGASAVKAADLDGDGDLDVLSASDGDGEIAWYPNTGNGNFPEKKIITIGSAGAQDVHVADLDGDGDQDILGAFGSANKVAWHENDGGGSFSNQKVITSEVAGAVSVHTADLDGDGNLDVLSASRLDGKVAYYMNKGDGTFSEQVLVSREGEGTRSVRAADIDGDGKPDVMYASSVRAGGSKIAWHRNTGSGFSDQNLITSAKRGARLVHPADLDQDGDQDLLATFSERQKGQITWAENEDGSFSDMKVISSEALGVRSITTADLDDDGDQDILATSSVSGGDGQIFYILSTAGTFASKAVVAENLSQAQSVYAADLDNSGVPDIVGASRSSKQIALYINDLLQGFGFRDPKMIGQ